MLVTTFMCCVALPFLFPGQARASKFSPEEEKKYSAAFTEKLKGILESNESHSANVVSPRAAINLTAVDEFAMNKTIKVNEKVSFLSVPIEVSFIDLKLKGLSKMNVTDFAVNLKLESLNFSVSLPELNVKGKLKVQPSGFWTEGPFTLEAKNAKIDAVAKLDVKKTEGTITIKLKDIDVDSKIGAYVFKYDETGGFQWPGFSIHSQFTKKIEEFKANTREAIKKYKSNLLDFINGKLEGTELLG